MNKGRQRWWGEDCLPPNFHWNRKGFSILIHSLCIDNKEAVCIQDHSPSTNTFMAPYCLSEMCVPPWQFWSSHFCSSHQPSALRGLALAGPSWSIHCLWNCVPSYALHFLYQKYLPRDHLQQSKANCPSKKMSFLIPIMLQNHNIHLSNI